MIETRDMNELIYESLFGVTQKALVIMRKHTEKNSIEQSLFFELIKQDTHEQKKRAKLVYNTRKDVDFIKFFTGVHKENLRKIMIKIKMYMRSQVAKGKLTTEEVEAFITTTDEMLNMTMEIELESFIEKSKGE